MIGQAGTSTLRLDFSRQIALKDPGMDTTPCPTSRSTNIGFRSSLTAYAARICAMVDLPWSVGPTIMTFFTIQS